MKISPIIAALARRLSSAEHAKPEETQMSNVSLERQEPDLAKEIGLTAREISGWAMGGSGSFD